MKLWILGLIAVAFFVERPLFSDDVGQNTPDETAQFLQAASTLRTQTMSALSELEDDSDRIVRKRTEMNSRMEPVGYVCQGRLTLEANVPVSTTDQSGVGTIRFTPFLGNRVALYNGTNWVNYTFSDSGTAFTLSALTVNANYDVFAYYTGTTVNLELSSAWQNNTTRTVNLTTQDGVYVKSGTTTRRYLGTFRSSSANTTEDTRQKRFVWNYYNRRPRLLRRIETTATWVYNITAPFRAVNANTANNKAEYVVGFNESLIQMRGMDLVDSSGTLNEQRVANSFAVDTSAQTTQYGLRGTSSGTAVIQQDWSEAAEFFGIGYHTVYWTEVGDTDEDWYGGNEDASGRIGTGFYGWVDG